MGSIPTSSTINGGNMNITAARKIKDIYPNKENATNDSRRIPEPSWDIMKEMTVGEFYDNWYLVPMLGMRRVQPIFDKLYEDGHCKPRRINPYSAKQAFKQVIEAIDSQDKVKLIKAQKLCKEALYRFDKCYGQR